MTQRRAVVPVVGGYLVHSGRVLLLWHSKLVRWVPAGGRVETHLGEYPHETLERELGEESGLEVESYMRQLVGIDDEAVRPLPCPVAAQEIVLPNDEYYFDLVFYCKAATSDVQLNYREATAYHWFTRKDIETFPLLPHVRHHAHQALAAALPAESRQTRPANPERRPSSR